jgi:hypothetical protein
MRKIESQMNDAISRGANWHSGNTRVEYDALNETSVVYLHNNRIAIVGRDVIQLFDGGWQSVTTKSRLNAILSTFGLPNERVFAKNFDWYVQMRDMTSIPFFSSMRLA